MLKRQILRQGRFLTPYMPSRSISHIQTFLRARPEASIAAYPLPPRLQRRWQSTDETKKDSEDGSAPVGEVEGKGDAAPENPLQKELDVKNREIIDLKDKYLRSVADFRNLQERTKRDVESARQFAIQRFAADLIDTVDNLERAVGSVPQDALTPEDGPTTSSASSSDSDAAEASEPLSSLNRDLLNLHAGLKMTESLLMSTLKKHGLERFDPQEEGRKFDPRFDEATFNAKVEGREDGDVFHTQQTGFLLNGRVLRAAKVGVVKNS